MTKFKKGDIVIALRDNDHVPKGTIGTVNELSTAPYVTWKGIVRHDGVWPEEEIYLELYKDKQKINYQIY